MRDIYVKSLFVGGNLAAVIALVGTPHLPQIEGGVLFLEDVG